MELLEQIAEYFSENLGAYLGLLREHILISFLALVLAVAIGVPLGLVCAKYKRQQKWLMGIFQVLRVLPSLAVILLLLPVLGTGIPPALTALVILAVPPILMNTVAGLEDVPALMTETAVGLGMMDRQVWLKVKLPLAMPMIFAGIRTAAVEILASATLAAKIGAGGLGELIFTGLGLNRTDLLIIGGLSVALLSVLAGVILTLLDRGLFKHKYITRKQGRKMKRKIKAAAVTALTALLAFSLAGCAASGTGQAASGATGQAAAGSPLRVGSKDFTESMIVAEIYTLALEDAGYNVEHIPSIAGSLIHTSITNDEIDLYPEYTGTGLLSILGMDMITDPQEVYDTVKEEYAAQFDITWLDYAEANDGQGLVMNTPVAQELGIETISDLQQHAGELNFASQGEFDERDDGIPALEAMYGSFDWKSSKVYDNGLKYELLRTGEADVAPAYTTEGPLAQTEEFTLLEDDKQVWPPYNLAPVVQSSVLKENPDIAEILNGVSKTLDTPTVTALNAKVDVDKEEYEDVAAEYYESIR